MLTRAMLRTDTPKEEEVLAFLADSFFCPTNTNIGRWGVMNKGYYLNLVKKNWTEGWISLTGLPPARKDAPQETYNKAGGVNSVLTQPVDFQSYSMCKLGWTTSNTVYYNLHRDEFRDWIGLEQVEEPPFTILEEIQAYMEKGSKVVAITQKQLGDILLLHNTDLSELRPTTLNLRVFVMPGGSDNAGHHSAYGIQFFRSEGEVQATGHELVLNATKRGVLPTLRSLLK